MPSRSRRVALEHAMALALLAALARCRRAPDPETHPHPASRDAATTDARDAASDGADARPGEARCPVRALPPHDLSTGAPVDAAATIAWSGREWGVAWTEPVGDETTVFFARVGADGRRRGTTVRVSERGYRASAPSIVWNGESWQVAFAGGAGRLDEIWMARVDARGTTSGRPRRVTARDRRDATPALAYGGRELLAAWGAALPDGRHALLALRMDRWGAQRARPVVLAIRRERLTAPAVVANGAGWGVAWLVARSEAIAVDVARLDAAGVQHGGVARATVGPLGGTDQRARFGLAWDGARYAVVWDELRDGAPRVFFDTLSPRLTGARGPVQLSTARDAAAAPAIVAAAPGTFLAAWEVERGAARHVQVRAFDADGAPLGEPVEVQGHDGRANAPAVAMGDGALGVATVTPRAVSFHRVPLGSCPGAPPPPSRDR